MLRDHELAALLDQAVRNVDTLELLVYSAGGYTFRDFVRAGVPLTIIMWLAFSWVLPRFYPLQ